MEEDKNSDQSKKDAKIEAFDEQSLREIAQEIVVKRMALKIHWIAFIGINLFLVAMNYVSNDFDYLWVLWATVPWFCGLSIHSFSYISFKKGWFTRGAQTAIAYHGFIVVVISMLLVFIDWFSTATLNWWYWAVIPLIISFLFHLYIYISEKPKKGENVHKDYMDRKVERELSKLKKNR